MSADELKLIAIIKGEEMTTEDGWAYIPIKAFFRVADSEWDILEYDAMVMPEILTSSRIDLDELLYQTVKQWVGRQRSNG